jgi:hypothetical protein
VQKKENGLTFGARVPLAGEARVPFVAITVSCFVTLLLSANH